MVFFYLGQLELIGVSGFSFEKLCQRFCKVPLLSVQVMLSVVLGESKDHC